MCIILYNTMILNYNTNYINNVNNYYSYYNDNDDDFLFWSLYSENQFEDLFEQRHLNIQNEETINANTNKKIKKCLGCNVNCDIMIMGKINTERTCFICLDSKDVCYGCQKCIDINLPSCCIECFNNIIK